MAEEIKEPVPVVDETQQTEETTDQGQITFSSGKRTHHEILSILREEGFNFIKSAKVSKVEIAQPDNFDNKIFVFTFSNVEIPYLKEDVGVKTVSMGSKLFIPDYVIQALLASQADTTELTTTCGDNLNALKLILCDATMDIAYKHYDAFQEIKNPFSKRDDGKQYSYEVIISHPTSITIGQKGNSYSKRLVDLTLMAGLGVI